LKPVWVVESMLRALVKLMVATPPFWSLLSRLTPRPGSVIAPENEIVLPPALPEFVTWTECPAAVDVIDAAIEISSWAALMLTPLALAPAIEPPLTVMAPPVTVVDHDAVGGAGG